MTVQIVTCWLGQPGLIPGYEAAVDGARVIIVDQASDPDTARALDDMAARLDNGSLVIHSETNLRFALGNNCGLAAVTPCVERDPDGGGCLVASDEHADPVVVFLNNDVQGPGNPPNRWLEMIERDVKPGGLYGPKCEGFSVDAEVYPYIEGWCIAARLSTWGALAGWDAVTYPEAYAEDVDLSWRARLAGLKLYQTRWPIQHLGNVTNRSLPGAYDHAEAQREVFRQRVRAWKRGELTIGGAG